MFFTSRRRINVHSTKCSAVIFVVYYNCNSPQCKELIVFLSYELIKTSCLLCHSSYLRCMHCTCILVTNYNMFQKHAIHLWAIWDCSAAHVPVSHKSLKCPGLIKKVHRAYLDLKKLKQSLCNYCTKDNNEIVKDAPRLWKTVSSSAQL